MNPPSALFGAMNKERKPFTYTPGGLDLSEIKSERMAQRLMRNAMSEGVPEAQVQTIQSPPPQLNSSAMPNFNCLPVQVFPTFPLPANPKSLLRCRSNADPSKSTNSTKSTAPAPTVLVADDKPSADEWKNINKPSLFTLKDNNGPSLTNDIKSALNNSSTTTTNYGSDVHAEIILPEKSYDAEYFVMEPQPNTQIGNESNNLEDNTTTYQSDNNLLTSDTLLDTATSIEIDPSSSLQERTTNDIEKKKVKIVKKQSKTSENEADQNGDTETALVVKLPSKKSSAKTETKVEVSKKTLPDGTVEEVKTTITKTTIDGKTEIKTKTETRTLPKEEDDTVEIEEQEEESEDAVNEDNESEQHEGESTTVTTKEFSENKLTESEGESKKAEIKENGHIISGEEKSEISTTKKVVVIQSTDQEPEEEQEEEIEEEEIEDGDVEVEQVIVLKKVEENDKEQSNDVDSESKLETTADMVEEEEAEEVEEEEEVVDEENVENEQTNVQQTEEKNDTEEPEEDEEIETEEVEAEEEQIEEVDEVKEEDDDKEQSQEKEKMIEQKVEEKEEPEEDAAEEYEEAEDVPVKTDMTENIIENTNDESTEISTKEEVEKIEQESESSEKTVTNQAPSSESSAPTEDISKQMTDEQERVVKITFQSEPKVSFREPSIPLEKVEDVEIKPIGPAQEIIKKCHTEIITTTKDEPTGALSTQTNYNRIENIVTVNRTTKILDHAYEQSETTIPSVNPYFVPSNICPPDRILSTPQPVSKSYQPIYTPEPQTERRHSLLLDRLSVDRQIPVQQPDNYQNNYQYNNQNYGQNQWMQEPQSEVLIVSNVKPSAITKNQQWYQQSKREENCTSNIVTPTPVMPSQLSQPQSQPKPKPQQQPQPQVQPQYQNYVQPQYTPKQEFQPAYTDNSKQNSFKSGTTNLQQNTYPSYTPKPSWVSSTFDPKPSPAAQYNQYSTLKTESSENYQKTTQPFSSSYVPPPWEQDSSYVVENQNFYQPPPTTTYTPSTNQSWKPKQPVNKFSKPPPKAYIPPAPNQSFVKPVSNTDAQILPGRKTYYSEYERRYISVPESTYIPSETKYQAQPDPSPQYYFDNNEPTEMVEPQWRKELREFTEKTSQTTTTQTEKTSVIPPWEEDPKYATGYNTYTSTVETPSWTQTLRPRSWRETSYEPEYVASKEWPKTNTLRRGRPQSSYVRSNIDTIRERTRGVSVDRYNPNNYQSPLSSEHPPVQSHTLNANSHPKTYHNPSVPAYHARTSAESREQTAPYIQRTWADSKAPPVQSRSFKYLQWITGTED
nr:LOW QUALITY PROTEIN: titin-like [Maniola hyperantus]